MGLKIHKYSTIAMIASGSGQFGQLHTTFSHTQNTCNLHAFEAEMSFMPFSRLYTASRVAVILSGGCEQILISTSEANFPPELVSAADAEIAGPSVRSSVRPIREYAFIVQPVRSRALHVRLFMHVRSFVHLGSFVRASAVHSLFFLWPGFNEV